MENLPKNVIAIYTGWQETCVVTVSGAASCWGDNENGTLGIGSNVKDVMDPTAVVGLEKGVVAMALGGQHVCALMGGGIIKCWGANYSGQLGNGTTADSRTPLEVVGITGWIQS
jgi:alpha-tubulin suppressor-like RCC1 family protein